MNGVPVQWWSSGPSLIRSHKTPGVLTEVSLQSAKYGSWVSIHDFCCYFSNCIVVVFGIVWSVDRLYSTSVSSEQMVASSWTMMW